MSTPPALVTVTVYDRTFELGPAALATIDQLWTDLHIHRSPDLAYMTLISLTVDLSCDFATARAVAEQARAGGHTRYSADRFGVYGRPRNERPLVAAD